MRPASPLTETAVTRPPDDEGRLPLPIAKNPWPRPRSVIGAMNTRASRTIVTHNVPNVSSSAAGFARTAAACAQAGRSPAVCIPTRTGLVRAGAYVPVGRGPDPQVYDGLTGADVLTRSEAFLSAISSRGLRSEYGSTPFGAFIQLGLYLP